MKVFGVTVHFVDGGVDTGPVILQGSLELPDPGEPRRRAGRAASARARLLPEAVRLFARGALTIDPANPRRVLVAG